MSRQREKNRRYEPFEEEEQDLRPVRRRRKSRWGCFGVIWCLFWTAAILFVLVMGFTMMKLDTVDFPETNAELGISAEAPAEEKIVNIALFGIDARDGDTASRSDAIMILSVDKANHSLKLSTVMRDAYVEIEGHGKTKLTKAYYYGGPELAVKTLNQNFNLDIGEYAAVDFNGMAQIIDAVGGVEIDISEEERKNANNSIWEQSEVAGLPADYIEAPGKQVLSDAQAVAYARIRYVGNADYQRTSRQRLVLSGVFDKLKRMNPVRYPKLLSVGMEAVETSLSTSELLSLFPAALGKMTLQTARFPTNADLLNGGNLTVNGESCLNFDIASATEKLHAFIYQGIDPATEQDRISNGEK